MELFLDALPILCAFGFVLVLGAWLDQHRACQPPGDTEGDTEPPTQAIRLVQNTTPWTRPSRLALPDVWVGPMKASRSRQQMKCRLYIVGRDELGNDSPGAG